MQCLDRRSRRGGVRRTVPRYGDQRDGKARVDSDLSTAENRCYRLRVLRRWTRPFCPHDVEMVVDANGEVMAVQVSELRELWTAVGPLLGRQVSEPCGSPFGCVASTASPNELPGHAPEPTSLRDRIHVAATLPAGADALRGDRLPRTASSSRVQVATPRGGPRARSRSPDSSYGGPSRQKRGLADQRISISVGSGSSRPRVAHAATRVEPRYRSTGSSRAMTSSRSPPSAWTNPRRSYTLSLRAAVGQRPTCCKRSATMSPAYQPTTWSLRVHRDFSTSIRAIRTTRRQLKRRYSRPSRAAHRRHPVHGGKEAEEEFSHVNTHGRTSRSSSPVPEAATRSDARGSSAVGLQVGVDHPMCSTRHGDGLAILRKRPSATSRGARKRSSSRRHIPTIGPKAR